MLRVAFIDRDGTLIEEPPNGLVRPEDFRILPGVIEGLKTLQADGFALVMVTNQDFVKWPQGEECFRQTQRMLVGALAAEDIFFDEIFLCPHPESAGCPCRKPKTGMVDDFVARHDIDRSTSMMIGDREVNDGGMAKNLGVRFVQLIPNHFFAIRHNVSKKSL